MARKLGSFYFKNHEGYDRARDVLLREMYHDFHNANAIYFLTSGLFAKWEIHIYEECSNPALVAQICRMNNGISF